METFTIKITGAAKGMYWYAAFIGQTLIAYKQAPSAGYYVSVDQNPHLANSTNAIGGFVTGYVEPQDAELMYLLSKNDKVQLVLEVLAFVDQAHIVEAIELMAKSGAMVSSQRTFANECFREYMKI